MTQTIQIDEPGLGYYEDDLGNVIGKFDVEPGEHTVPDEVANVVYVSDREALRQTRTDRRPDRDEAVPDWQQRWQAASTPEEKLQVIEDRFF